MNRYHFYLVHVMVGIAIVAGACAVLASPREKTVTAGGGRGQQVGVDCIVRVSGLPAL